MTSELRPAVEVWCDAYDVWGDPAIQDTGEADKIAADVIEAYGDEREAKFKALAETLVGKIELFRSMLIDNDFDFGEAVEEFLSAVEPALRQYKEARDAS